ncbi:hypothetical protein ACQUZK_09250, partial [Streptococcus pyogenes]|uniref:hypothetical protein n=1 Tax=Streptococcus pyogenes TaxID=1314 RepID=UPI003DA1905D
LEKLSISRVASHHEGWQYHVVTNRAVPDNIAFNLEWIRRGRRLPGEVEYPPGLFTQLPQMMLIQMRVANSQQTAARFCEEFEATHTLSGGVGLRVLQILLWEGQLSADVRVRDLAKEPLSSFRPRLALAVSRLA